MWSRCVWGWECVTCEPLIKFCWGNGYRDITRRGDHCGRKLLTPDMVLLGEVGAPTKKDGDMVWVYESL